MNLFGTQNSRVRSTSTPWTVGYFPNRFKPHGTPMRVSGAFPVDRLEIVPRTDESTCLKPRNKAVREVVNVYFVFCMHVYEL